MTKNPNIIDDRVLRENPYASLETLDAASNIEEARVYDEAEHPRDDHGRWTDKNGSTVKEVLPPEMGHGNDAMTLLFRAGPTPPSQAQVVKLQKAYTEISRMLSDPEIGAELYSVLTSMTPESLRERIHRMSHEPGDPIYGGTGDPQVTGPKAAASAHDAWKILSDLLKDPDTGAAVEALLNAAIKAGSWQALVSSSTDK